MENVINELIQVGQSTFNNEVVPTVNARELHEFLESKQDYSTWIKNRINQYEFVENQDFIKLHKKMELSKTGQTVIDYHITLDMAKELSMVERNSKGKQARQYFIQCEKKLNQPKFNLPTTYHDALRALADVAEKTLQLENKIALDKPKVDFADRIESSVNAISIGNFAKTVRFKDGNKNIGQNLMFKLLRDNRYLQSKKGTKYWNIPYQKYINNGYFEVKEISYTHPTTGVNTLSNATLITGKGQIAITEQLNLILKEEV